MLVHCFRIITIVILSYLSYEARLIASELAPPKIIAKNLCDTCIEFPANTAKITIGVFSFSIQAAKAGEQWAEELLEAYGTNENISLYLFGMLKELDSNDTTNKKRFAAFGKRAKRALYEKFLRSYLEEIFHPYVHLHADSNDIRAYQEYLNHIDYNAFYTLILDSTGKEVARFSNSVDQRHVEQIISNI